MGSGPNAFPEEMAGGNSGIRGMGCSWGSFGGGGGRFGERGHGGGMRALGKKTPTPCLNPNF
jgi:hypothetical protein